MAEENAQIHDRLAHLRREHGLTQEQMARAMGVPYSTYQRYEQGRTPPKMQPLARLASEMGISLDWLVLGWQKTNRIDADAAENLAGNASPSQMAATVEIPVYDVKAGAGPGAANGPESVVRHVPVARTWLQRLHCPLNSLQAIEATGDSMEPDIHDGDVLLVDTSVRTVERSGVYVLRYADHLRVKYLQQRADGGIIIRSAAPQEVDETVPRDRLGEIAIIGRVVWTGRHI